MKLKRGKNGRAYRVLLLCGICLLLLRVPAVAQRMGSVDVNGSEVAYQAQYDAYTEAASQDGAVVCKLSVENPTAGKNGAVARIVMPDGKNTYLYMDEGSLAVMQFDGSEYKKFKEEYELKKNTTYTLCVFQDGLVFLDGVNCYKYSGDFYGFTDVAAGWSDQSNVFSVLLEKSNAVEPDTEDGEKTDTTEEKSEQETKASPSASFPSVWIILVMLLAVTSNLVALAALRTSNIALRAVRPNRPNTPRHTVASSVQQKEPQKVVRQHRPAPQPVKQQKKQSAPQSRSARPAAKPQEQTTAKKRPTPELFDQENIMQTDAEQTPEPKTAARKQYTLAQPFDLYRNPYWRANPAQFVPYRFGSFDRGYCTFERGRNLSHDLFVLLDRNCIWLNPIRFHPRAQGQGVPISMAEYSELSMVFDFCHVGTGVREIALSVDVEMVNFRPARIRKNSDDVWELDQRGIIVFE